MQKLSNLTNELRKAVQGAIPLMAAEADVTTRYVRMIMQGAREVRSPKSQEVVRIINRYIAVLEQNAKINQLR